jgi:RimK family alpha-L-glutamate ligase
MKIAILSTSSNYLLQETIRQMGHEVYLINPMKCYMTISPNAKGFDKLHYGDQGDKPELIKRGDFDIVVNRIGSNIDYSVNVLRFMNENLSMKTVVDPTGILVAADKGRTLQKLSLAGIPVPKTVICERPVHVDWIVKTLGTDRLIIKTLRGSQGKTVAIVDSKVSANSVLNFIFNTGQHILIEEFIESGATDFRVWIIGGKVVSIMKRSATNKTEFKANLSTGGKGETATLSDEDKDLCIRAAAAVGLSGMAAVDLLKDSFTGESFIIEVNSNGGEGIVQVTNKNHYEDLILYCEQLTGKKPAVRKMKRAPGTPETDGVNRATRDRLIMRDEAETVYFEMEQAYIAEKIARAKDKLY